MEAYRVKAGEYSVLSSFILLVTGLFSILMGIYEDGVCRIFLPVGIMISFAGILLPGMEGIFEWRDHVTKIKGHEAIGIVNERMRHEIKCGYSHYLKACFQEGNSCHYVTFPIDEENYYRYPEKSEIPLRVYKNYASFGGDLL